MVQLVVGSGGGVKAVAHGASRPGVFPGAFLVCRSMSQMRKLR
jgi:hypothetical protein